MPLRPAAALLLLVLVPAPSRAAETVTFGAAPPTVGDRSEHAVDFHLRMKATTRRGAEVLEQDEIDRRRAHRRVVTTTEVAAGRATAAEVAYGDATEKMVAGKTYHCRRDGEELRVADASGALPPFDEFQVVARHMQMLGKPNPLAAFLRGKSIAVGEAVDVPPSVAKALFGAKSFDAVSRFRLTLQRVVEVDGRRGAAFLADIRAEAVDGSQMRMEAGGPMVIDAATCRLVSAELIGPIGLHHHRHDPGGRLQVSATGRLTAKVGVRYRDAPRSAAARRWSLLR